jgi:hypothetical protein
MLKLNIKNQQISTLLLPHPLRDWLFLGSLKTFGDSLLEIRQLLT